MNNSPQPNTCPQCRAILSADAPQGLCPACLLAAVAEPTEAGTAPLPKTPPPTREQVAAAFPQLEVLELIGAGGMGYVFKARQPKLDRLVALKLLPQSLAADPAFAGSFEREGRILARLSHSNIVTVHDFGFAPVPSAGDLQSPPQTPDAQLETPNPKLKTGFYYLLMEFVDGVNLRQAMRAGRFTPVQALEVVPKICEALQFAHEQGILHRDIKPENILLDAKGRVKLVDFGIAKLVDDGRAELPLGLDAEAAQQRGPATLTSATAALGTPSYMAPEQRDRPADVDHRADIYSLGVVFYEMLTGELPVGKFAPPSAKSASDPRVDEVVLRALEQQRERRQQSAGEVKTQVENIAATHAAPRPAAPLPTYAQKKTKDAFVGPGFAMQVLGIICLFIPFIGLFLGIVLIIIGTQMAVRVFCTNCGQQAARDASHCEHCNALFSGPPPRLGFFRRSLGWSIFLGALATLALVIGFTMVIGGTALSEWLKNSPLFTSRKSPPKTASQAETNKLVKTTTAPPLTAVGSLRLIAGGAHRNVAIARAESLTGHPLHEVVARFAGPAISSNSWLHARNFGPTLGPAQDERLGEGWRGEPVDSQTIWSQSDTLTPASSTRFFCPNECQLQFALEDDAEAVEASRQIRAALSQDVPLVVGKRVQLFRVGEREAWLEVRSFQSVPGKLAVFSGPNRRSGRSPVHLAGTNRIDSAVLAIPPNSELTLTGFLYDGIPTAPPPALFTTSLTNSASQPGLYWLTWRTGHDLPPSNAPAETGWQFHVHDGLTAKELHRFQSPASLNFNWQMRWAYQSNSVMPSVGLLQTLLTFGNAGDQTGPNRYRAIMVDATLMPLPTKRSPE